jgi:phosphoserine phosphatase
MTAEEKPQKKKDSSAQDASHPSTKGHQEEAKPKKEGSEGEKANPEQEKPKPAPAPSKKKAEVEEDEDDPYKIKKEDKEALDNAQKRYDSLIEKRDELNTEANEARNERDLMNEEKGNIITQMKELKAKRDALKVEIDQHKKLRDTYQKNAKMLIQSRKNRNKGAPSLDADIELLNSEIMEMERKYETTSMEFEKEKELIDKIRVKRRKLQELMKDVPVQVQLSNEVKTMDERITELFKQADEEHKAFMAGLDESKKIREQMDDLFKRMKNLAEESDKKHQLFLETKEKANKVHAQITEMREKLMAIRRDAREKRDAAMKIVREQNAQVRATFNNEQALKEYEEKALEQLLKKGKFSK